MAVLSSESKVSLSKWILLLTVIIAVSAADVPQSEESTQLDSSENLGESYRILKPLGDRRRNAYPRHREIYQTLRPKPESLSPGPLLPLKEPTDLSYTYKGGPKSLAPETVIDEPAGLKDRINKRIEARLSAQSRRGPHLSEAQPLTRFTGAVPIHKLRNFHTPLPQRQSYNMGFDLSSLLTNPSPRNQAKEPVIDIIGGVGNPSLLGVPIDLGNSNRFLVPSDVQSTTQKPVFGGVGDSLRQTSPLVFGGSFGSSGKQFVSVRNQPSVQTASPLSFPNIQTPLSRVGSSNPSALAAASSNPSPPTDFNQLVRTMQAAFASNPSLRDHMYNILVEANNKQIGNNSPQFNPQLSGAQSTAALSSNFRRPGQISIAQQPNHQNNAAALLRQFYQENALNSAFQQQSNFPLRIPGSFQSDTFPSASSASSPLLPADQPYFPAEHSPLNIINSPGQLTENQILGIPSANAASLPVISPQAATVSYTNIRGCVQDTWCALALAAAVAAGATSALAVPFLAPILLGRRRRDAQFLVFSQEEAPTFTNHFMRFKKGDDLDIPEEEVAIFTSLQDEGDNRVKRMFDNIRHFIVTNKEQLLNITIQEIKKEKHIPIPEDILQRISNKSRVPLPDSIAMMLDPASRKSSKDVPEHKTQTETSQSNAGSNKGDIPTPITVDFSESNDYNPPINRPILHPEETFGHSQTALYSGSTQGFHQSDSINPYVEFHPSSYDIRHGYPSYLLNHYPHLIQSGVTQSVGSPYSLNTYGNTLHFSAAGNRDSYPIAYRPNTGHWNSPAFPQPQSDVSVIRLPQTQQKRPLFTPAASAFYGEVCSAVGQDGVPDNDIIRFIMQKCALFQFAGMI